MAIYIPIWEREAARTVDNIKGNPKRVKKTKAAKAPKSAKSVGEKAAKEAIDGMKKGSSWRPPNETPRPTPASSVASKAPGLLSKWGGRALTVLRVAGGPASVAIQAGILPGDLGDSDLESPQGGASNWVNENPEEAVSATQRINNLISRGIQGAKEKWAPPPVQEQEAAPQALPQVPEPEPEPDQQQQQIEIQRQTVEIGALKGLETGQVSRPSLAEAIVEADAQRAGEQLTPEQSKQAVQQELTSMKTMGNKDLSKYVSYALIAGGVLASFMDKSGKAEGMFHDSFNRQLDRGEEAKAQAAAAEQAALKHALDERKVSATEADIGSKVEDRTETRKLTGIKTEGLLDKWITEAELGKARLGNERARTGIMGSRLDMDVQNNNIKNNLAARKLNQYGRRLGQWDEKLKQDATSGSGGTGVPLSYEDNTKLVSDVLSAKGVKVTKEVKQALAARLPTIQKLAPDLSATQMTEMALEELKGEVSIQDTSTFNGWMGKDMKYSFDKLK